MVLYSGSDPYSAFLYVLKIVWKSFYKLLFTKIAARSKSRMRELPGAYGEVKCDVLNRENQYQFEIFSYKCLYRTPP